MKRSSNKFLHRVRIHGGEFDASARAMHRDGMTSSFQAAVETVSIATNERKQMSTKTTFKRIALVTVAALGFGLLSTAPSGATASAGSFILSSSTASQLTGDTATSGSAIATLTYAVTGVTDTVAVTASLYSAVSPTGAILTTLAQPKFDLVETATAQLQSDLSTVIDKASLGGVAVANDAAAIVVPTATSGVTSTKIRVWLDAPTKAGTYVVKLTPSIPAGSTAGSLQAAAAVSVTITVTTNPLSDTVATSAKVILNKGETSSATADDVVTSSKTIGTSQAAAATLSVSLLNAAGVAANESFTATISGSGTLGSGANSGDPITGPNATGRAITVKKGDVVQVFSDGSSGTGTITISSAAGAILATKKVTFYGTTTKLTTTVVKSVIGPAATGGTLLVTAADSAGTEVQDASIKVFTSDATIISNAYTACGAYSATNGTVGAGYLCSVTGVKAGTSSVTATTKTSATDTTATAVSGTAVSVRVGSQTPGSVSVAFDKSTYVPGEKATLTVTLKDSAELALADGTYTNIFASGGLVSNYTWSGALSDTTTATSVDDYASGVKSFTVYMPLSEGTVEVKGTTGATSAGVGGGLPTAAQGVAIKATATVVSASGSAATDAANEATDAANAATDAANAAAEAADAATAAAQDAADAVAALSTQVAGLIADLKAQITSLTNLVIKIQKKIKA